MAPLMTPLTNCLWKIMNMMMGGSIAIRIE